MVVDPTNPNKLLCVDEDPNTLMITRKRHTNFPRYPNYDFLQVEEINQILYNYTRNGFVTTATINTKSIFNELKKKDKSYNDRKSFDNVLYNFVDISYSNRGDHVTWTFIVRNRLWNGRFDIRPHQGTKEDYNYVIEKTSNGNTLIIKSKPSVKNNHSPLKNFDLILHMSNADLPRNIRSVDVKYEGVTSVSHPYDQNKSIDVKFLQRKDNSDEFKTPLSGCIVQLVPTSEFNSPLIPKTVAKEVRAGVYRVIFPKTISPMEWKGKIQIYENSVEPDNLIIEQLVSIENQDIYTLKINFDDTTVKKGRITRLKGSVTRSNSYGYELPYTGEDLMVNIYHTYNKANDNPLSPPVKNTHACDILSAKVELDGTFSFDLNGRGNYDDETEITFSIGNLNSNQTSTPINRTITHEWFIAEDWDKLKSECENENGADVIVLRNRYYNRYSKTNKDREIFINRESTNTQYIIGRKGKEWATLNNDGQKFNFIVKPHKNIEDGMINKLILKGIKFKGASCVISQEAGTYVNLVACNFENNLPRYDTHSGCCVYQNTTSCVTDINNCYFDNNYGNLFVGRGLINITNSLIYVTTPDCVMYPEVYICDVMSGNLNFKKNTVYINPFEETELDLKGFYQDIKYNIEKIPTSPDGIFLFYIGKSGKINGKTHNQLQGNKTLLLNGMPDSNNIFIFLIILYDLDKKQVKVYSTRDKGNSFGHIIEDDPVGYNDGFKTEIVTETVKSDDYVNPYIYELEYPHNKKMKDTSIIIPGSGGVL